MAATKDQQVKRVVEGLALGVLANDVVAVTSAKLELEFALAHAWRSWDRASAFPSLTGVYVPNWLWIGMGKSERRQMTTAAWARGQWSEPYVSMDSWTVDECLDHLLAEDGVRPEEWVELGRLFVDHFKPEHVRRAT